MNSDMGIPSFNYLLEPRLARRGKRHAGFNTITTVRTMRYINDQKEIRAIALAAVFAENTLEKVVANW